MRQAPVQSLDTQEARNSFRAEYQDYVRSEAEKFTGNAAEVNDLTERVFQQMNRRYATRRLPADCRLELLAQLNLLFAKHPLPVTVTGQTSPAPFFYAADDGGAGDAASMPDDRGRRVRAEARAPEPFVTFVDPDSYSATQPEPMQAPASLSPQPASESSAPVRGRRTARARRAPEPPPPARSRRAERTPRPEPTPVAPPVQPIPIVQPAPVAPPVPTAPPSPEKKSDAVYDEAQTILWTADAQFDPVEVVEEAQEEADDAPPADTSGERSIPMTVINTALFILCIAAAIFLVVELKLIPDLGLFG